MAFDAHGQVPTRSGLVHPVTGEVTPAAPEQFCTWRIEAHYNPDALCLWWLTMLEDAFADRPDDIRVEYIDLIAGDAGRRFNRCTSHADYPRPWCCRVAPMPASPAILEVMSRAVRRLNRTPLRSIRFDGAHGLMPFMRRVPWVLHEAFDQRKWHFSFDG